MNRDTAPTPPRLEACVTSVEDAVRARRADRLELCRDLASGGLTPGAALVRAVVAQVDRPVVCMVRPRPGSHRTRSGVVDAMIGEIAEVRSAGAGGLALGLLDARGRVDVDALRPLVVAAGPLPVTFHRAFDEVADPLGALDDLVALGVARVLTGGGPGTAWEGRALLRELVRRGGDRITVVAGGRVRAGHAAALVAATGVRELHARAEAFPALAAAVHGVDHRA